MTSWDGLTPEHLPTVKSRCRRSAALDQPDVITENPIGAACDAAGTADDFGSSEDGGGGAAPSLSQRLLLGHTAAVVAVCLGEGGTLLATAQSCRRSSDSSSSGGSADGSGVPSGGKRCGTGSGDGGGIVSAGGPAVLLWDLRSGRRLATLSGTESGVCFLLACSQSDPGVHKSHYSLIVIASSSGDIFLELSFAPAALDTIR